MFFFCFSFYFFSLLMLIIRGMIHFFCCCWYCVMHGAFCAFFLYGIIIVLPFQIKYREKEWSNFPIVGQCVDKRFVRLVWLPGGFRVDKPLGTFEIGDRDSWYFARHACKDIWLHRSPYLTIIKHYFQKRIKFLSQAIESQFKYIKP